MKNSVKSALFAAALLGSGAVSAGEVNHFKGLPAENLEQAVTNFSEYNHRLELLLAGELGPKQLGEVHELTYTLENALAKMNDELKQLAETLEAVHKASETADAKTVYEQGKQYLATAKKVVD